MPDDENIETIEVKTDDNKSPSDLADEIQATAAALGGQSPGDKKVASDDTKTAEETAKVEDHSVAVKTTEEAEGANGVAQEPEEEGPAKIEVKKRSTLIVDPNTKSNDESESAPAKATVSGAKTIDPVVKPADSPTPAIEDTEKADAGDSKPATESTQPEENSESDTTSSSTTDQPETANKLDMISSELKAQQDEKEAAKTESEQQQAKVYDTKKYHLPIKPNSHHRKSGVSPAISILILVIAVVGMGLYAISAGYIDIGLEIPGITPES